MIDVHAHILPKVDDGSASVEESIEMLTRMRKQGVTTVVATPHFDMRRNSVKRFLYRRNEGYQRLMEATRGMDVPTVLLGAEVLYCGVGLSQMEQVEELCLGHGNYLLVETLKGAWDSAFLTDMRKLMAEQNITPVIAHIERYMGSKKNSEILSTLSGEGALIQSNASFFCRKWVRRKALKMLKEQEIQLLGSDCHDSKVRIPNLGDAMKTIEDRLGERYKEMLIANAEKVVFPEGK